MTASVRERQKTTRIVSLDVSLTSWLIQFRLEIFERALVTQRTTEISQIASFFDRLLSRVLESGDALSALYPPTATFQPHGDPIVVTILPDE